MSQNLRWLILFQYATCVGLLLFWGAFFTIGLAPENPPPGYFIYEYSFPFADIVLAFSLALAGYLNSQRHPFGRDLSLICSGALVFLGLVDFSFNLQNNMFFISVLDTIFNSLINLWCVGFGISSITWLLSVGSHRQVTDNHIEKKGKIQD